MGRGGPRAVSSHRSAPEISGAFSAAVRGRGPPYCVIVRSAATAQSVMIWCLVALTALRVEARVAEESRDWSGDAEELAASFTCTPGTCSATRVSCPTRTGPLASDLVQGTSRRPPRPGAHYATCPPISATVGCVTRWPPRPSAGPAIRRPGVHLPVAPAAHRTEDGPVRARTTTPWRAWSGSRAGCGPAQPGTLRRLWTRSQAEAPRTSHPGKPGPAAMRPADRLPARARPGERPGEGQGDRELRDPPGQPARRAGRHPAAPRPAAARPTAPTGPAATATAVPAETARPSRQEVTVTR